MANDEILALFECSLHGDYGAADDDDDNGDNNSNDHADVADVEPYNMCVCVHMA